MKHFNRYLTGLMLIAVFLAVPLRVMAAEQPAPDAFWKIPFLGLANQSADLQITNMADTDMVKSMLAEMKKQQAIQAAKEGKPAMVWDPRDYLQVFQLAGQDKTSWKVGYLVVAPVPPEMVKGIDVMAQGFFQLPLTAVQEQMLHDANHRWLTEAQPLLDKFCESLQKTPQQRKEKAVPVKIELRDMEPIHLLEGASEPVYTAGTRVIGEAYDFIDAEHVRLYLFSRDGKLVVAALLTKDSERVFLTSRVDKMLSKVTPY